MAMQRAGAAATPGVMPQQQPQQQHTMAKGMPPPPPGGAGQTAPSAAPSKAGGEPAQTGAGQGPSMDSALRMAQQNSMSIGGKPPPPTIPTPMNPAMRPPPPQAGSTIFAKGASSGGNGQDAMLG